MKLAITQNITVDGVVEAINGWFDPAGDDVDTSDMTEELQLQMQLEDGFLVGRQTFEDLRGYWPAQADDTTGITDHLNQVEKYVVSSTLTDPGWERTTIVAGDPIAAVAALKAKLVGVLGVTGSIQLCHALMVPASSTSTASSSIRSSSAAAGACSPTAWIASTSNWPTTRPSARASVS